jgi:hypothetical protein
MGQFTTTDSVRQTNPCLKRIIFRLQEINNYRKNLFEETMKKQKQSEEKRKIFRLKATMISKIMQKVENLFGKER